MVEETWGVDPDDPLPIDPGKTLRTKLVAQLGTH